MKTVAVWNGIDHAVSKPAEMVATRWTRCDAAGGLVIAFQALL
jgi:hypothetical protein